MVRSKIDYCNSLYYGINDKQMQRLQGIQNTLCQILTSTHRFSSITGPLMLLHWLPVKSRVQFKVCLITYKMYKNKYPVYLQDCVQPYSSCYKSIYNTWHSGPTPNMLTIPHYDYQRHTSFKYLSNSYFYSAPRLWNSLPETCRCASSLSSFRAHLKT